MQEHKYNEYISPEVKTNSRESFTENETILHVSSLKWRAINNYNYSTEVLTLGCSHE